MCELTPDCWGLEREFTFQCEVKGCLSPKVGLMPPRGLLCIIIPSMIEFRCSWQQRSKWGRNNLYNILKKLKDESRLYKIINIARKKQKLHMFREDFDKSLFYKLCRLLEQTVHGTKCHITSLRKCKSIWGFPILLYFSRECYFSDDKIPHNSLLLLKR